MKLIALRVWRTKPSQLTREYRLGIGARFCARSRPILNPLLKNWSNVPNRKPRYQRRVCRAKPREHADSCACSRMWSRKAHGCKPGLIAGADTASALAAGNPVIFKGHPAHPGTGELVGHAVREAVLQCKLPEGVFSLLFDGGNRVGTALIKHPLVKAAGFTGSRVAGRILMDLAAARPEPIPVFAEMSSTNPVFILPGALR